MIRNPYYSHGKLLITGEYFVLDGATAFAVPLKRGQSLSVSHLSNGNREIILETELVNGTKLKSIFNADNLDVVSTFDIKSAVYTQKLLRSIKQKSDVLNRFDQSLLIQTKVEFPLEWGLGSSSSLISNLGYWSGIDPYTLLFENFRGSGYDIAAARSSGPILYTKGEKPLVQEVSFNPDFLNNIYFIYLEKKQDSLGSIKRFGQSVNGKLKESERISEISKAIIGARTLKDFESYIIEHESIISKSIGIPTVKSTLFDDFNGTVKSLGAWGGDFVMATHQGDSSYVKDYFSNKGYKIVFTYNDLVLW